MQKHRAGQSAPDTSLIMTCGNFDPLHFGHIDGFCQAKSWFDVSGNASMHLIVQLDDDETVAEQKGVGRPVWPLPLRAAALAAVDLVSLVIPFRGGVPDEIIKLIMPDGYFKGSDRSWEDTPERQVLERMRIPFFRTKRRIRLSSSAMIERVAF